MHCGFLLQAKLVPKLPFSVVFSLFQVMDVGSTSKVTFVFSIPYWFRITAVDDDVLVRCLLSFSPSSFEAASSSINAIGLILDYVFETDCAKETLLKLFLNVST